MTIRTELRDCQVEIFDFTKDLEYFGIFAEYGIGKTLCALSFVEYNNLARVLVVGIKKNTEIGGAWHGQIGEHTNYRAVSLTDMSNAKRNRVLESRKPGIYLINYDGLGSCLSELIDFGFQFVVFDESTQAKSSKTRRWKACKKLSHAIQYRCVMTGMPITENYLNLWSQIYLLDHGKSLGKQFFFYMKRYFYKDMYNWNPRPDIQRQITLKIKDFCISKQMDDCFRTPVRKVHMVGINPTEYQKALNDELLEYFEVNKGEISYTTQNILPIYMKTRQICSGFFIDNENDDAIIEFETPKDDALLDTLQELDVTKKVIIWAEFEYEVRKIYDLLKQYGYRVTAIYQELEDEDWRTGPYDIYLSTPAILGAGETIHAKYAIRYAYGWSYENKMNSDARNRRRGSIERYSKVLYINLYLRDTIEEYMIDKLNLKKGLVFLFRQFLEWRG